MKTIHKRLLRTPHVEGVEFASPSKIRISLADGRKVDVALVVRSRAPRPSELSRLLDRDPGLLVAPNVTATVRRALEASRWSWLDDDALALRVPDGDYLRSDTDGATGSRPDERAPSYTELGVTRLLVTTPTLTTQTELADALGVSQPAISQAMKRLRKRGILGPDRRLVDVTNAVDWWIDHYRPPSPTIETYWYSLDDPWTTTEAVVEQAPHDVLLSGAVAADVLAPWLSPDRVVAYTTTTSLPRGLAPLETHDEATLVVVTTEARDIRWRHPAAAATSPTGVPVLLADPLQMLWDVIRLPSDDPARQAEAASQLRRYLISLGDAHG